MTYLALLIGGVIWLVLQVANLSTKKKALSAGTTARRGEPRHLVVARHLSALRESSRTFHRDNATMACLRDVLVAEGKLDLLPPPRQLLRLWRQRHDVPRDYIDLSHEIEQGVEARLKSLSDTRKEEEEHAAQQTTLAANQAAKAAAYAREATALAEIQARSKDLIETFFAVAERKVATLDEYGDANWDALDPEVQRCVQKVAARDGASREDLALLFRFRSMKKGDRRIDGASALVNRGHDRLAKYWLLADYLDAEFRSRRERAGAIALDDDIAGMAGTQFEAYIAEVLKGLGFASVRGTAVTGDQGADLIAVNDGRTVVVQAKRYQRPVGNKAVQEVIAAMAFYKGDEAWVVTNSTFTPAAVALAQSANVRLVDGAELRKLAQAAKGVSGIAARGG